MMLLFPKTCLYETYSVLKCLDLINCYFMVMLSHNKKMPIDFHYDYFYTGIKCILESNHSLLLQMVNISLLQLLSILYKYYSIFAREFKETLNNFIIYHVFNQLFLHWNLPVRNIFHLLLIFKIGRFKFENPESLAIQDQWSLSSVEQRVNAETIITNIQELRQLTSEKKTKMLQNLSYYQKMREKLKDKKKIREQQKATFQACTQVDVSTPRKYRLNNSDAFYSPIQTKRKWSLTGHFLHGRKALSDQELKYLPLSLK